MDCFRNSISYSALPTFLQSQLQAQKITDGSILWVQVVPFLTFVQSCLRPFGNTRGYPTLFVWYCRELHRSFLFFAFLDTKMTSLTYTANELLGMKHVNAKKKLLLQLQSKVQKDNSLGMYINNWIFCQ